MPSHFIFIQKSQNSRLGSREKDPIRFCGGVYVAKNTLRGAIVAGWPTASRGAERSEKPRVQRAKLFARVVLKAPDRHGVVVRALFDRENLEVVAAAVFHLDLYALARAMAEDGLPDG